MSTKRDMNLRKNLDGTHFSAIISKFYTDEKYNYAMLLL